MKLNKRKREYVIFLYCGDILKIEKVINLIKRNSNFEIIAVSCTQNVDDKENIYLRSKDLKFL